MASISCAAAPGSASLLPSTGRAAGGSSSSPSSSDVEREVWVVPACSNLAGVIRNGGHSSSGSRPLVHLEISLLVLLAIAAAVAVVSARVRMPYAIGLIIAG